MFKDLFKKKPIELAIEESEKTLLKRTLSSIDLIFFGIGAIIGAGIFALVGTAASFAGPGVIISFILAGLVCLFSAFSYAELSSSIPISGSAYTYSYIAFGEFIAFLVGWNLILEYLVGNMAVAISWSAYFKTLLQNFNIFIPDWLSSSYNSSISYAPKFFNFQIVFNLPAFLIMLFITFILIIGIKESARLNNILVFLKVFILLFFIIVGFSFISLENFKPFMPNGFSGVLTGAGLLFFAYIGFDAISTTAEEVKNPKLSLPVGIVGSLLFSTVIYILVAFVLIGVLNYKDLNVADPLAKALSSMNLIWASSIISVGAIISTTTVLLVFQTGQSRIFLSMARDGLVPKFFSIIHPKFKTPYISIIICGLVVAIVSGFVDISSVAELTNIGTLFAFIIINLGVIYLRIKKQFIPKFKTPFFPIFPILGVLSCFVLMLSLPKITWIRFIFWLFLGILIYFFMKALKLSNYEKKYGNN
ncbi:MAG: amino acid permease [candidate division WOR-3 bacterium]